MTLTLIAVAPKAEPNADATYLRVPEGLDLGQRWTDHERAVAPWVPATHFLCGFEELHRERSVAFHMSWLHVVLYNYAYPDYECQRCVGQDEWAGCECQSRRWPGPCVQVGALRAVARDVWSVVARRCGMYDPARSTDWVTESDSWRHPLLESLGWVAGSLTWAGLLWSVYLLLAWVVSLV